MIKKVLLILLSVVTVYATEANIEMLTEHYPPYNMKVDGKLTGSSVELLDVMLKKMNSSQTIKDVKLTNWSRAYNKTLKTKNSVLFTTTRTELREDLFKWVGPIQSAEVGLIALKSKNIKINDDKDLDTYKIGTVLEDVGEQLLIKRGVSKKNLQYLSGENAINLSFSKMERGRIDMFSYNTTVAFANAKKNGFDSNKYEVVYTLKKGEVYFAFNKDTDDAIIQKWQKALDQVKSDGTFNSIIAKYK
jgi:polar amino acid transport system substrate-binding protein